MPVSLASRVRIPQGILVSKLNEESVILNLDSESYFGLDAVGTRMWEALNACGTVDSAYEMLLTEYDVDGEQLRRDLCELIEKLSGLGLIEVADE